MRLEIIIAVCVVCIFILGCIESGPKTVTPSIPDPYYSKAEQWLDHSVFGIEKLIGPGFITKLKGIYSGEMATYLEWILERYGFDTKICISRRNGTDKVSHAWTAVDIGTRRYFIDPVARNDGGFIFNIIKPENGNYELYARYDRIYNDIYELSKSENLSEFDWWNIPVLRLKLEEKGE